MKCDFCGREVNSGTTECPYCHYQFKIDAKVLSPNERDTFDGVTIEEDGSSSSSASPRNAKEEQNREYQQGNRTYGQRQQNGFGGTPPPLCISKNVCGFTPSYNHQV